MIYLCILHRNWVLLSGLNIGILEQNVINASKIYLRLHALFITTIITTLIRIRGLYKFKYLTEITLMKIDSKTSNFLSRHLNGTLYGNKVTKCFFPLLYPQRLAQMIILYIDII